MRQSEFKRRFDPEMGRYVRKNIYDESIVGGNIFTSIASKLFGKTTKELAKKGVKTAATKAVTKTGEHIGNKAGDKIVQLLSKKQPSILPPTSVSTQPKVTTLSAKPTVLMPSVTKQLSDMEIADRVNQIISGGKMRRRKIV